MLLTALAIHRPGVAVAGIVASVLCGCMPAARGDIFSLTVDTKSNIYASGLASTEGPGVGRVLRFTHVSGTVSYNDVDAPAQYLGEYNGPDGGADLFADANFPSNFLTTSSPRGLISPSEGSPTTFYLDMDPFGGISGMKLFESTPADRRVMFLAGVFLTDLSPAAQAPPSLDFSSTAIGRSFTTLSPLLQQTFYIGDGLTGQGSGSTQSFLVPDDATRLFLGILDGAYFVGGPDYYNNNVGSFAVQGTVAVPEPATWVALVTGAVAVGCHRWRRSGRHGTSPR
jgi:hypothetical protein